MTLVNADHARSGTKMMGSVRGTLPAGLQARIAVEDAFSSLTASFAFNYLPECLHSSQAAFSCFADPGHADGNVHRHNQSRNGALSRRPLSVIQQAPRTLCWWCARTYEPARRVFRAESNRPARHISSPDEPDPFSFGSPLRTAPRHTPSKSKGMDKEESTAASIYTHTRHGYLAKFTFVMEVLPTGLLALHRAIDGPAIKRPCAHYSLQPHPSAATAEAARRWIAGRRCWRWSQRWCR